MPTAEASTPSVSASATTERSTWRRLAPRARSMANSRRRCATVMLKALKMMKAPTKTETPANASSIGVRKVLIEAAVSLVASAAACSPVLTLTVAGRAVLTRVASSLGVTPGSAAIETPLSLPGSPPQRCTSCRRPAMTMVPPMEPESPHVNTPVTVTCWRPAAAATSKLSPGFRPCLSAKLLMIADLVAGLRLAPGDEPGLVEGRARVGGQQGRGAAGLDGLAVHDRGAHRLVRAGGPGDARHPLDLREHRGVQRLRAGPVLSIAVNAVLGATCTAVPLNDVLKMSAKPLWIWSVSTYVPVIIATPSRIARMVRTVRSGRLARLRKARRVIGAPRGS